MRFANEIVLMKQFLAFIAVCLLSCFAVAADERISFNRDVRPILSENCFFCHGPDAAHRQADLRLDVRDEALAAKAFVPGKPDESPLLQRIHATAHDEVMPPPVSEPRQSARGERFFNEASTVARGTLRTPPSALARRG